MKSKQYHKQHCQSAAFLIAAAMALILAGCGQDEMVSAGAEVQMGETVDTTDSGGILSSVENDTDTSSEGNTAAQEGTEPEQKDNAGSQIEIDDETRQQLTAELLEENEMDVSVVEAGRSTTGCTFELPEGFEESQDVDGLYVTARYPLDTSMIYYEVLEGDISLQLMTEEMFKEEAEKNLSQVYDEDIAVNIDSYESVKVDGYPAFHIVCHYEAEGIRITQLEYLINADKTYVITYSQTSDYDWMEAYEASAATIHVK